MNTGPQATRELLPPGGLGLRACTRLPASGPSHWLFPYPECCSLQTGTEASLLPTGLSQSHVALGRPSRTTLSGRPHLLSVVMAG